MGHLLTNRTLIECRLCQLRFPPRRGSNGLRPIAAQRNNCGDGNWLQPSPGTRTISFRESEAMNEAEINSDAKPATKAPPPPRGDDARLALLARLSKIPLRSEPSLQPTPEAAKSRIARIRRKRRQLILHSRSVAREMDRLPPAPDPMAPRLALP